MKRDPSLVRLSRDHHRGLMWATHIERNLPTASDTELAVMYEQLLAFWREGLLPHFRAECECVLARLARRRPASEGQDDVLALTQRDHLRINTLMVAMVDDPRPATRRAAMQEVGELLKRHIRWEEAVLFEATQQELTPEELIALETDVAARIPEMPPPAVWES